ncbi:MAG: aldo/keto reductase, partial [Phycisphaeraceae bacterium]|nr:aldo/keto reductase [Phycisphaeraceae bacterium]
MTRRQVLQYLGAGAVGLALPWSGPVSALAASDADERATATIPGTDQTLPVIGMGTWQTFNVGRDPKLRRARTKVLAAFFTAGGGMIDSSPMYGSSQAVVGDGLERLDGPEGLFAADKVWTRDGDATDAQVRRSRQHWGIECFDLMQVHNLLAWRDHLPALREMKAAGRVRYIGITTSHGRRHEELERIMRDEPIDFVQLTYNLTHRSVERRL